MFFRKMYFPDTVLSPDATPSVLYYYDELSVHEIAKITGCLEGTVKSRLHFARRQLKKMLSDAGEEETGRIIYERG